jgi:superfamily II DNA helicase RecQ
MGKVCFLLPPLILDIDCEDKFKHISIVILPLKSLMLDQCHQNSSHGISAAVIKSKEEMSSKIIEGTWILANVGCLHIYVLEKYIV